MTNLKDMKKITLKELQEDIAWLDQRKMGCCHHVVATTDEGTDLAIVVGWEDGFEEAPEGTPRADGTWRICAKFAYQHANNAMQCDYDVDWLMPYDPDTGEVCDTSTEVNGTAYEVRWLNAQAKDIWRDFRKTLDILD